MKKLFSTRTSDSAFSTATFLLRIGAGALMMVDHGFDKLMHFAQKSGSFPDPFGIGHPTSMAMVIFAEFFCSVFIILGLFTRVAAVPLVIAMSIALFYIHKGQVFGAGENAAIYLTCFLAILLLGPGRASLDNLIGK